MRTKIKSVVLATAALSALAGSLIDGPPFVNRRADAQAVPTPTPARFDQAAAIAKLKEQIKGREQEPADKVFKNIQTPFIKSIPAGRMLAVMEFGYARSLGVTERIMGLRVRKHNIDPRRYRLRG